MSIEVTNEPPPPPRKGPRIRGGCHVLLVKESTGEIIQETKTPDWFDINERVPRDEPKY